MMMNEIMVLDTQVPQVITLGRVKPRPAQRARRRWMAALILAAALGAARGIWTASAGSASADKLPEHMAGMDLERLTE